MAFSFVDSTTKIMVACRGARALRELLLDAFNNGIQQIQKMPIVATGSTNADAALLGFGFNVVTGANATKGVILPAGRDGNCVSIKNNAAAVLKLYPPAGMAINALTVTTGALSMAANTTAELIYDGAAQVWSLPLVPS